MSQIKEIIIGVVQQFDQFDSLVTSVKNTHQPFAVVDILIVATIFYFFFLFLRQTRALGILYGILVLALIWAVGQALNLSLLNTLLRWTFTSILVAIPVVFQPELRQALEKIGRSTKFVTEIQKLSKNELELIIDEIVKSIVVLSKNKYGALIIIARSSGLREYCESGQQLDANVNTKLIVNIFTPKAPLHDGAVIISGNKIISAAATLPLSEDVFDLSLGTRHKAALTLTMETDALGLIVSEETGIISLAVDGRLQRNLNIEELKQRLTKLLTVNKFRMSKK